MQRTTPRIARKSRRCEGCSGRIDPGRAYLEHVASPDHGDLGNRGWWRLDECEDCAVRCGRGDILAHAGAAS